MSTGYSHPQCYAAPLRDCSKELSREHYVSRGLLEAMGQGGPVTVSGFSWQRPGEQSQVGVGSLCAKILCARHNTALSELDEAGTSFTVVLRGAIVAGFGPGGPRRQVVASVCGDALERWMLKILYGVVAAGQWDSGGQTTAALPHAWLAFLFGLHGPHLIHGMYFGPHREGEACGVGSSVTLEPLRSGGRVSGIHFGMSGLQMGLALDPPGAEPLRVGGSPVVRRPSAVHVHVGGATMGVALRWAHGASDVSVELTPSFGASATADGPGTGPGR